MNRRNFIKNTLASAIGVGALPNKFSLGEANTSTNYKAMVCIFMAGGNDSINTIVPTNNNLYNDYSSIRQHLSIPHSNLLALNGTSYGLHPSMPELHSLFNAEKCGVIANIGTLLKPTTKQMVNDRIDIPINIGSHSSQISMWQKNHSGTVSKGWAGLLTDSFMNQNLHNYLSNISISATNELLLGNKSSYFNMSSSGVDLLNLESTDYEGLYHQLLVQNNSHILERAYATIQNRANETSNFLSSTLNNAPSLSTTFATDSFSKQLAMVADMIQIRETIGMKKQIFFVNLGGFDSHSNQLDSHGKQLSIISRAMSSFYDATVEMGIENQVTTFTMSDFGRSILINSNNGTDHGWGGHHFIVGGAVNGGQIYGEMPDLTDEQNDNGRGSLIPTIATEQYAATLAQWFGTDGVSLNDIFPNLSNFPTNNLGFMSNS